MKWPVVECRVAKINYDMPTMKEWGASNSVVARLTLVVIGQPLRWDGRSHDCLLSDFGMPRSTRNNSTSAIHYEFDVNYRLTQDTIDFLIPKHLYMKGVKYPWRVGSKFQTQFKVCYCEYYFTSHFYLPYFDLRKKKD